MPRTSRMALHVLAPAGAAILTTLNASPLKAQPAHAQKGVAAPAVVAPALNASRSTSSAAWALPDADVLIEKVFARIVSQDKPAAIPMNEYGQRLVGRQETVDAVRKFAGHPLELRPSAFSAVDGWSDARRADYHPCIGDGCEKPVNSLWIAVTKIERGELPHELHVWYTTSFAAKGPTGPDSQTYSFCERWLRVNGVWKYDGFVRVTSG